MEVVNFIPQPLYPQGNNTWYPLDGSLGGPQSRSGCSGKEKKSCNCTCQELNPSCPAHNLASYIDWDTVADKGINFYTANEHV
jgi:hypothetical protein